MAGLTGDLAQDEPPGPDEPSGPAEPRFSPDLYRGTASDYDAYRVPYPPDLLDDLRRRARLTGRGRLLDLACGTGQVTFGLSRHFAEVRAVDQEPEAVALGQAKAARLGLVNVHWSTGRAEDVTASGCFELVTIGNAFHRLQRKAVARSAFGWLAPGGHLALLWSDSPWSGGAAWQRAMKDVVEHWASKAGTSGRVPAGWAAAMAREPHTRVLEAAGFTLVGTFRFPAPHQWTVAELAGFAYSTSVLSRAALGRHAEAFERDLTERLVAAEPAGVFREQIPFGYELLRRP